MMIKCMNVLSVVTLALLWASAVGALLNHWFAFPCLALSCTGAVVLTVMARAEVAPVATATEESTQA